MIHQKVHIHWPYLTKCEEQRKKEMKIDDAPALKKINIIILSLDVDHLLWRRRDLAMSL